MICRAQALDHYRFLIKQKYKFILGILFENFSAGRYFGLGAYYWRCRLESLENPKTNLTDPDKGFWSYKKICCKFSRLKENF